MIGLKTRHAVCRIMSKEYPALLKRFTIRFKRLEKFGFPMIFSIKFWNTNTVLHKFFQTDMIFFDQFKVPTIKFGKRLCGVYDTDSLRSLAVKNLLRLLKSVTCEDALAKRIS